MRRIAPLWPLLLGACAAGPDYVPPAPPPATAAGSFVESQSEQARGVSTEPAQQAWWRLFADPTLDRLVGEALGNNRDIAVAVANLRQARAVLSEARAGRLPTTDASAGYTRRRIGTASPVAGGLPTDPGAAVPDSFTFDSFSVGFDAAYELDLFGRVSRSVEAARGEAGAAAAALDDARVSVAAETALAYIQACGFAERAEVARETARLQAHTLDLTQRLFTGGRGTRRDVDRAAALAEQAKAQVPQFEAERRAALYALATLTGRPPAELDAEAASCKSPPKVATLIPVGDGAALLKRRPDVARAERALAAATARIGVATAALYPSITLLGSVSLGAQNVDDLGKSSSFNASVGPLISWSFPNIAVARARIRQARGAADARLAEFDGTVLTALRETEQALARYSGVLSQNEALGRAEAASANAARLSRLRFDYGADNFLDLLDAERARAEARGQLAQSNVAVAESQIALFKALGGGWAGTCAPRPAESATPQGAASPSAGPPAGPGPDASQAQQPAPRSP